MTALGAMLVDLARMSLREPRRAARTLIAADPPAEARWLGLLLVAVLAVIELRLLLLMPMNAPPPVFVILAADLRFGVPLQFISLVVASAATAAFGRIFGGRGRFIDALLIFAWLEFLLSVAQIAQLAVEALVPSLGGVLALVILVFFIVMAVSFIAELHGFRSLILTFFGMIGGFAALVVALALVLALLGLPIPY